MINEEFLPIIEKRLAQPFKQVFPRHEELLHEMVEFVGKQEDETRAIELFAHAEYAAYKLVYLIGVEEDELKTEKEKMFNHERVLLLVEDVLRLLRYLQNEEATELQKAVNERLNFYMNVKNIYAGYQSQYSDEVREAWKFVLRCKEASPKNRDDLHQLINMMFKQEQGVEEEAAYMLNRNQEHLDAVKYYMQTVDENKDENVYCELTKWRVIYERAKLMFEAVQKDIEKEMRAGGTW